VLLGTTLVATALAGECAQSTAANALPTHAPTPGSLALFLLLLLLLLHQVYLAGALQVASGSSAQAPLLSTPLMDASEHQLVLEGFNAADLEYDRQTFVHGQFMQRAKETPDAPCVVYEDFLFTYAEVGQQSRV
jgi:non-ribosomal peptide synthetase component F